MDHSKQNENTFTVVIAERNTGIVIHPVTLKWWTETSGDSNRTVVDSLEQARQFAETIVSARPDLEVTILNSQGEFVECINGLLP